MSDQFSNREIIVQISRKTFHSDEGATDTDTTTCVVIQPNRAPTIPTIDGPMNGTKNTLYTFSVVSTDADNDTLQYSIIWGDEVSAANISQFLPSGTIYTCSHRWSTAGKYTLTVRVTDNKTNSTIQRIMWIDTLPVSDTGYLIDTDGDGLYDSFYNELTSQSTTVGISDGTYLIDSNGDGKWDFTYNEQQGLVPYQEAEEKQGDDSFIIIGIVLIVVVCGVFLLLVFLRRKKII